MPESASIEVSELLPDSIENLGDEIRGHMAEQGGPGGRVGWPGAGKAALKAIRDKLSFDVVRAFGAAWAELKALREYKDEQKHPRGKDEQYELGKNKVTLQGAPQLRVSLGAFKAPPMSFGYTVEGKFEAVTLTIRDGAVTAAAMGGCEVTGVLSLGGSKLHDPCSLAKGRLPGRVAFDPPIAIP